MVKRGALENRLEPFYYVPSLVELENKIREIANGKLNDYALKMSSGATPLKSEEEKYYSDAENGIPFIRVQNLHDTNELSLDDLKYINHETHQKDLKRSQVAENDLLVKITGVGRMAVACVPPLGFEGNTNQHLVVIKTKDRLTSETLATYLNTNIVEKLASRRSTGGTRPALDYTSLKSIPVIFKPEIVDFMKKAVEKKRQKEAEAKELLASIDAYLLEQLGIVLPDRVEEKNVFYVPFSKVQGNRFDPFYHKHEFIMLEDAISAGKYGNNSLKEILTFLESGSRPSGGVSQYESGILSFGGEHVNNKCEIEIRNEKFVPLQYHLNHLNTETQLNDIILVKDGATTGKIGIITNLLHTGQNINEHVFMMRFNLLVNPFFVLNLLATSFYQKKISRIITGATVTGLTKEVVRNLQIPLPTLEIQTEIANHIRNIRERAKTLETEAKEVIEKAKAEIEKIILG